MHMYTHTSETNVNQGGHCMLAEVALLKQFFVRWVFFFAFVCVCIVQAV